MNCALAPLKCVLFVINVLFWICGGVLLYSGIYYMQANDGSFGYDIVWPAVLVLSAGSILILGGIAGCIGTISERKGFLGVFLVLLFVVLIAEVCVFALMFAEKTVIKRDFDDFVLDEFERYDNDSGANFNSTSFVDVTQKNLECCGYNNYSDWSDETWHFFNESRVPVSCCNPEQHSSNQTNATCTGDITEPDLIYTEGCKSKIDKLFNTVYDFVTYGSLAVTILVLIGIIFVLVLLYRQRNLPLGYSQLSPGYTEA